MNDSVIKFIDMCMAFIGYQTTSVNPATIDSAILQVQPIFPGVDTTEIKNILLSRYNTTVEEFRILDKRESREPWLNKYKAEGSSSWLFWNRYKDYLEKVKGFAPSVTQQLDKLTDKALDNLFDPNKSGIDIKKKGLVVGQVQSGKTSNYTGLICKAADAGFNLIIILAGIHNNLRSQTQIRIDEGFIGFDTQYRNNKASKVGVGNLAGYVAGAVNPYTTSDEKGDFTIKTARTIDFDDTKPAILVVKKNSSRLKAIYEQWLQAHVAKSASGKIEKKSLLIIDDEADNASINTNADNESPTAINGHIKNILNLFHKSAYVGYTATPFANIFIKINDDDLFPSDFIINLPAPSNYIGPEKVFGLNPDPEIDDSLPIVTIVNDYEGFVPNKHKSKDPKPTDINQIPESMRVAIKSFILTCAIRAVRGQVNVHNSMLIHVTRFKAWQKEIKLLVEELFNYYKNEIKANDASMLKELRDVFENDSEKYSSFVSTTKKILDPIHNDINRGVRTHSWQEILPFIKPAVEKIEVKEINGTSGDSLEYFKHEKDGLSVIAIGGDKLSRGLTLEGLSVSYFLRASTMYDTLMQMGRWFGYRPGYVDLCRLFVSAEINSWYKHIAVASDELRKDFDYLAASGGTPDNFALKVRNHPGQLIITSLTKMRNTREVQVSWAGSLAQTYALHKDKSIKHINCVATENFISELGVSINESDRHIWQNISPDVICDYLSKYKIPEDSSRFDMNTLCDYIKKCVTNNELTKWNVVFVGRKENEYGQHRFGNIIVNNVLRSEGEESTDNVFVFKKNHIIGSQQDEFADLKLDPNFIEDANEKTKAYYIELRKTWNKTYPDPGFVRREYRSPETPLLLMYSVNTDGAKMSDNDDPYIGIVISFPKSNSADSNAVSYTINNSNEYTESEKDFIDNNDNDDDAE